MTDDHMQDVEQCPDCKGHGVIRTTTRHTIDGRTVPVQHRRTCAFCDGQGMVDGAAIDERAQDLADADAYDAAADR